MQASKQPPSYHKNESKAEIVTNKIDRTLWEPSSLEKIERRSNIEERFYEIDQNQIGAYISAVDNPKELIKEVFAPWKVHNLKRLKELRFRQQSGKGGFRWNRVPAVYMKKLGTNISSQFKHLQKLHIVVDYYQEVNGKDLQETGFQIGRNLPNLRCLKMNFNFLNKIHVNDLQIFIREISKNLTNLKEFRFYIDNPEGMTGESLSNLIHYLHRYLRKLERLTFHCPSNGPKDKDIEKFLLEMGSSFPKLENLKLGFGSLMEFGPQSIKGFNYLLDQYSTRLKGLALNFGTYPGVAHWNDMGPKEGDFEKIIKAITTKLVDLQTLKLGLRGIRGLLTDKGIKKIAEEIFGSLPKLIHFSLYVNNKITDQGLKAISSALSLKKNTLQRFKLEVINCPYISNQGFDVLMSAIANHLPTLQELELNFSNYKKIGSDALRSLAFKVIKPSLNLKKLKFNFSRCRGIKGKGLEEFLIEIVNKEQNLESVNLVFEHIGNFGKYEDKINELLASCPLIKWKINNY